MSFALFLVLNGVLLIRPEELFPEIAGLRLYLIVILACTLASLGELRDFLSRESLVKSPVSVCVLAYFLSTIISLCVLGRASEALFEFGPEFAKVILYFCLLVSIVNSEQRYRATVISLLFFITILVGIAMAQHFGVLHFPTITPCSQQEVNRETGETFLLFRMVSSGIFNDPNDLCLVIGFGILSCIYLATDCPTGNLASRMLWLCPVPIFVFALIETHSRGGLIGVLAGVTGYLYSRFGGPRALPYAAIAIVGALAMIGGRSANISGGGTAHERLMMWADGLSTLFNNPIFLLTGMGDGWFIDNHGLVAHNSFVQAYVEQGLLGGTAFLGAFAYAAWIIDRLGRTIAAPYWVIRARPFAFGAICGYAMGCYSLTRNLTIPTYLMLGLASVIAYPRVGVLPSVFQVDRRWFVRTMILGLVGLVGIKFATQLLGLAGI